MQKIVLPAELLPRSIPARARGGSPGHLQCVRGTVEHGSPQRTLVTPRVWRIYFVLTIRPDRLRLPARFLLSITPLPAATEAATPRRPGRDDSADARFHAAIEHPWPSRRYREPRMYRRRLR